MRFHTIASGRPRRLGLGMTMTAAAAVALAACSGSGSPAASGGSTPATSSAAPNSPAPAPSTPATSTSAAAAADTNALSGTWSGQYGGAYSGTFTLRWRQSGSRLSGTIRLSNPPGTVGINGTVSGGKIQFGTVGSFAVTYSGSVSGDSMSGNYRAAPSGGSWSASKTS